MCCISWQYSDNWSDVFHCYLCQLYMLPVDPFVYPMTWENSSYFRKRRKEGMWQIGLNLSSGINWCLVLSNARQQWCSLSKCMCVCVWCPRSCMSGDSLTASFGVVCISCKAEILGLSNSVYCGVTEWWYKFLSRYFAYFGVLNACQHVCSGCCQARYWGDGLMPPDVAALKWACYAANLHVIYNYW